MKVTGILGLSLASIVAYGQQWTGTMQNNGYLYGDNVSISGQGSFAGLLNFQESHLGNIEAVCADLYHDFAWNTGWTDAGWNPASGFTGTGNGWGGNPVTPFFDSQSLTRAGNIVAYGFGNFASLVAGSGFSANDVAAAIQISVWGVLYNSAAPSTLAFSGASLNVNSGANLRTITITSGNVGNVETMANTLWGIRNVGGTSIFLQQTSNPNSWGQDQLTSSGFGHHLVTPEPFTMSLGLAGIGLFIRRRAKSKRS